MEGLAKVLLKVASRPATLAIVVFGFLGFCALALGRADRCEVDLEAAGIQGSRLAALVAGQTVTP